MQRQNVLAILLSAILACVQSIPADEPPAEPGPLVLDDLVEPLTPQHPRTAAEEEQLEALALFAAGRTREQQQDFAGALRLYQRALRHDPDALPVLEQIVPLAFALDRPEEAVRYALKAVELDPSDSLLLRRLALHLTEQGDLAGALKLYQKAHALEDKSQKSDSRAVLLMEMGRLYYLTEDYTAAADSFAQVQQALEDADAQTLDPEVRKALLEDPTTTYELFGEAFLKANRSDQALAAFEKAYQDQAKKGVLGFHRARVSAATNPKQALKELDVYFTARLASKGSEPYALLAQLLTALDRQKELIPKLAKLHGEDEKNIPLGYYLAEQYRQADQSKEAEALFIEMLAAEPQAEGYVGLAKLYRQTNQPAKLLKILGEVAAQSDALEVLGDEAAEILKDQALVQAMIEAAQKQQRAGDESFDYGVRLAAAVLAIEVKQFDAAKDFYNAAIQAKPEAAAELLMSWGLGLLVAEQYADSAAIFQRGIDERVLPADNPAFHYYLAGAQELAGKTEEALSAARHAVSLAEDSPRLVSRVAWILYHAQRYDEAAQSYMELIQKFDSMRSSPEVTRIVREARLVLSNICVLQDNLPRAEEWLEQVLDEDPDDISALNDLGYLWADQGKNRERALRMIQRAVEAEPENTAYRDSLGWALYRLGRYQEAIIELEKATAGEEPDGVILDHLGDAYQAADQTENAKKAWKRALKVFDAETEAAKIKATEEKLKKQAATDKPQQDQ